MKAGDVDILCRNMWNVLRQNVGATLHFLEKNIFSLLIKMSLRSGEKRLVHVDVRN
jgi:hypothetical protein